MSKRPFFEGWYFKHQQGEHTVAFIPAHHRDGRGVHTASLQIVTEDRAEYTEVPIREFQVERRPFRVRCGDSVFSPGGCRIDAPFGGQRLTGTLRYGPWAALNGDIMGPFRFVPSLQCRHSVLSMAHSVEGNEHDILSHSSTNSPMFFDSLSGEELAEYEAYAKANRDRYFETFPLKDYHADEVWLMPGWSRVTTENPAVTIPIK